MATTELELKTVFPALSPLVERYVPKSRNVWWWRSFRHISLFFFLRRLGQMPNWGQTSKHIWISTLSLHQNSYFIPEKTQSSLLALLYRCFLERKFLTLPCRNLKVLLTKHQTHLQTHWFTKNNKKGRVIGWTMTQMNIATASNLDGVIVRSGFYCCRPKFRLIYELSRWRGFK